MKDELFERVIDVVAEVTECAKVAILSRCRHKDLADARIMAVSILYEYGYSITHIARLFNFKTHGSAWYLIYSHKDALYVKKYNYLFNTIKTKLDESKS